MGTVHVLANITIQVGAIVCDAASLDMNWNLPC